MGFVNQSSRVDAIRVMVVDDSAVVRGIVSRQLEQDAAIDVACTASNGEIALRELQRHQIDVVILDLDMPVMDGLTALQRMVAIQPGLIVVIASTSSHRNAEISMRALQLGAADYVCKPGAGLASATEFRDELLSKIKALHGGRSTQRAARAPAPIPPPPARPTSFPLPKARRVEVLAIGASTGGPPALLKLFQSLKGAVQVPILLTQHMPATFTALLAEQLSRVADRPCAEGQDGEAIQPGRCYIAPGGWHMIVESQGASAPVVRLNQEPPENFCRPAVDPMLRSVARIYGPGALAVILTGMGADGAKGCQAVAQAGGRFIAQDEATSVVWGMPGAAAATGLADSILPLDEIGPWVRRATEAVR